jgi:Zn-dependent protease
MSVHSKPEASTARTPGRGRYDTSITETIGDTPIVRLDRLARAEGVEANLFAKLEFFNPLASVKDRIGLSMIDVAEAAFGPEERDPNGPISVVGVGRIAGEIASIDTIPVVERVSFLTGLIASLNVALFVFNLVPLLPLDGGHIAGALWEGLRRWFAKLRKKPDPGPIDTAKLVPFTLVVVILLGAMSVLLIYADIVKPISLF